MKSYMQKHLEREERKQKIASPDKIEAHIASLAEDLRPEVKRIEASPATTRGHYGDYMSMLSALAPDSPTMRKLVACALLEAGANVDGVRDALRVLA